MDGRTKTPIGVELVRRGIVTEEQIEKALEYQKSHSNKKIGDIISILGLCDSRKLIQAMGDILSEKALLLTYEDIKINISDYISMDVVKEHKVMPFEVTGNKIKVCFADGTNQRTRESVRLLLLNKGLVMDRYITFASNIEEIIKRIEAGTAENIDVKTDPSRIVDSMIKNAIEKRASDIHLEPLETSVRVRFRIDGELLTIANIEKAKQSQIIGRLKSISNMYQEKQESQDGRITIYPTHNIRVSSQKNIYGEKFVLRLLEKNSDIKNLFELGFPNDDEIVRKCFNKRNSVAIVAAPTGEGKTTTLYSIIDILNNPGINITTIEDPVEIRINGLNQIEIDSNTSFSDSLRTVLRQDPDIVLVGEIRDSETAAISVQAGHTGHYVLSTIHTIDAIEVITRLRKLGISNYDIASTLATAVSQRLVRKICNKCKVEREFNKEELEIIESIYKKYDIKDELKGKKTYDAVGCKYCNNTGYYGRIGAFEILIVDDDVRELIIEDASSVKIRQKALENGYNPLIVDGIKKVIMGVTTLSELNKKLVIY